MLSSIINAAHTTYPGFSAKTIYNKLKFLVSAFIYYKEIASFYNRLRRVDKLRLFNSEPSIFGVIRWPYINKDWDVRERLDRIATHHEIIKNIPKIFDIKQGIEKEICMISLDSISPNVNVILDRPLWFIREGEIVLNLFLGDLRVVSIAFIFSYNENSERVIIVGAIQGIHSGISREQSLEIFKKLTKEFAGLRPRTIAIEILRNIALTTQAIHIYAVSEGCRQHHHKYFGYDENKKLITNYDEIWHEHEAVLVSSGFYEIPIEPERKPLIERPSKKRSMYKRREKILMLIRELLEDVIAKSG